MMTIPSQKVIKKTPFLTGSPEANSRTVGGGVA
jgi:hypothetical protein